MTKKANVNAADVTRAVKGAVAGGLVVGNQGLRAVGQWSSDEQVAVYVRDAEQARLADAALGPVIEMDRRKV